MTFVMGGCYLLVMQLTVEIPDMVAEQFAKAGVDLARAVLESIALQGYRSRTLSEYQMRLLLGFETRWELWDFLRDKKEPNNMTVEDWEKEERALAQMRARREESALVRS